MKQDCVSSSWRAHVITLFPEVFPGTLGVSVLRRALMKQKWELHIHQLRQYGVGKHACVDDTPYGGGAGMILRPDVIDGCIQNVQSQDLGAGANLIYLSPRGQQFSQSVAQELSISQGVVLLAGRYEGIDQRVLDHWKMREIRVSDSVLCGGEVAAMLLIEACVRLLPGVISEESLKEETFSESNLCEYPQYTRPFSWKGLEVPEVLTSGNHQAIKRWRESYSK